jgi:hypothetical protein
MRSSRSGHPNLAMEAMAIQMGAQATVTVATETEIEATATGMAAVTVDMVDTAADMAVRSTNFNLHML